MTAEEDGLISLFQTCYSANGFGGGQIAMWPDGRGPGYQPTVLVDAFAVIEGKMRELSKARRGKREDP